MLLDCTPLIVTTRSHLGKITNYARSGAWTRRRSTSRRHPWPDVGALAEPGEDQRRQPAVEPRHVVVVETGRGSARRVPPPRPSHLRRRTETCLDGRRMSDSIPVAQMQYREV